MKAAVKELVVKAPVKALKALVKELKKALVALVTALKAAATSLTPKHPKEFLNKIPNSRSWSNP